MEPKFLKDFKTTPPSPKEALWLLISWPFQLLLNPLYWKIRKAIDEGAKGARPF